MRDKNLFGEMQKYSDPDDEKNNAIKLKIKDMIIVNEDYENMVRVFYGSGAEIIKPPSFEEFWKEQEDHLFNLYEGCKNWGEFVDYYYFCDPGRGGELLKD